MPTYQHSGGSGQQDLPPTKEPTWDPRPGKALVLRTAAADGTSYSGAFQWPTSGPVTCDDWHPAPLCGRGLHGALWGTGDGSLFNWDPDALWQVVEVDQDACVDLSGKVKFPGGVVVYSGARDVATALVSRHAPAGTKVIGGTATAGDWGTATAGDRGTATAGYEGTATAGDWGTATAGYEGTATAGDGGLIVIAWWDDEAGRHRKAFGEVGVDGIQPGVLYRVIDGKLAPVPTDLTEASEGDAA
jgi:hypothetical protein